MKREPNRDHKEIRASAEGQAARALGKQKLDKALLEKVSRAINITWQQVGYDALQMDSRMSNSGAIEICIDADRLWFCSGLHGKSFEDAVLADEALAGAFEAHSYSKVLRFLARNIKLT